MMLSTMPSPRSTSTTLWVLLASAAPPLVLLLFILHYSVPVVSSDSWGLVPYVEEVLLRQKIDLPMLFGQTINEHRIALPLFLTFATALLTRWNLTVELLLTPLAAAASFLILCSLVHRSLRIRGTWQKALMLFVFSSLIFSITHRWLWLVSIYLAVWLCNACFLGAVALTPRRSLRFPQLLAIITLCFAASFSFGYGLLSWIAITPSLISQWFQADSPRIRRRHALSVVFFLVAGVATWVLYLHDFSFVPYHPSPLYFLQDPHTFILFILTLAGAPLTALQPTFSPFVGALLGVGTLVLLRKACASRTNLPTLCPWISITLFSWLSMILIAIGRSGLGIGTALGHRYLPISTLGIIGLLGLLALVYSHRRAVLVTTLLTVAIIVLLPSLKEPQAWQSISASMRQGLACLQTYPIASDACLQKLNSPYPREIREKYAPILVRLGVLTPVSLPPSPQTPE